MIPAKLHELKKSFYRHLQIYESAKLPRSRSHLLLLFYAVECGLKAMLLKQIRKDTTESFNEHFVLGDKLSGRHGHNIKYMAEYLKIPDISLPKLPCVNRADAAPEQYQEVWRYGIKADERKEKEIEQSLCNLVLRIREEL